MSSNPAVVIGVSAVDTARQTLSQVDDKIRQTTNLVEDSGSRISAIGDRIKQNWQNLAVTAAGLTAGVVGFATSFGTLEKAQNRVDLANLTYEKSLERLNKAQESGKVSAEKLALMQEEVRVNADKARLAQDDLGDSYTNFLAQIPSQMLSFGISAIGMWQMLGATQKSSAATSVASSFTYSGALAGMNAATVTTTGLVRGLGAAMKAAFISNPIGLAILGISTVAMLLVTNFDAVSSAVQWLGKTIYDFLAKALQPLIDGMTWLYNNTLVPLAQMLGFSLPSAAATASSALDGMKTSVSETVAVTDSLQVSVKRAGDETEAQTRKMSTSWQKLTTDLELEVTKIETIYRRIPNPIGGDLRTPVDAPVYFGSNLASQVAVKNSAPSIVAPANFGTGNGALGTLAGNTSYLNSIVKKNALGGEGMVYQPTLFLAGENGPEGYKFTPGREAGGKGGQATIIFEIDGKAIAHAVVDDITILQNRQTRITAKSVRQTITSR